LLAWCDDFLMKGNYATGEDVKRLESTLNQLVSQFSTSGQALQLADAYYLRSQYWQVDQHWVRSIADLRRALKLYEQEKVLLNASRCIAELISLYLEYGALPQANRAFDYSVNLAQEDGQD